MSSRGKTMLTYTMNTVESDFSVRFAVSVPKDKYDMRKNQIGMVLFFQLLNYFLYRLCTYQCKAVRRRGGRGGEGGRSRQGMGWGFDIFQNFAV